jgi:hypothetical protein
MPRSRDTIAKKFLGDLMTDLLKMLHDERASLAKRLAGIDAAISALNGAGAPVKAKKRTMSAAVRAKISKTAKARWAKVKR